jgi:uncharacterized protein YodC (DUF2158 family)
MAFQIGDIVQLKSGGPHMTVTRSEDESISCTWFDKNQQRHDEGGFPPGALKAVSEPKPSSIAKRPAR